MLLLVIIKCDIYTYVSVVNLIKKYINMLKLVDEISDDIYISDDEYVMQEIKNTDFQSQEKQKYINEIDNTLQEIRVTLENKTLDEKELAIIIKEINNIARNLEIDNKILNFVHELIFLNFRKDLPLYHKVPVQKIIVLILFIVLYICDIFANIILFIIYATEKKYLYSVITLLFYMISSICISYSILKRIETFNYNRCICIVCNLTPVLCCFQAINVANTLLKNKKHNNIEEQTKNYDDLKDIYLTLDRMKQYVGFLHCAPQLTFQLALLFHQLRSEVQKSNIYFHLFLISTSFLGFIIAVETRFKGQIFQKLWLFPIIVARILSICILVFKFSMYINLFLIFHWVVSMAWWYFKAAVDMEQFTGLERILVSASEAIVSTFIPIKFLSTDIHFCMYVVHFIENIIANVIWAMSLTKFDHSNYIYALVIGINITYFLFGMSFKLIVTKFTKNTCTNSKVTDDITA